MNGFSRCLLSWDDATTFHRRHGGVLPVSSAAAYWARRCHCLPVTTLLLPILPFTVTPRLPLPGGMPLIDYAPTLTRQAVGRRWHARWRCRDNGACACSAPPYLPTHLPTTNVMAARMNLPPHLPGAGRWSLPCQHDAALPRLEGGGVPRGGGGVGNIRVIFACGKNISALTYYLCLLYTTPVALTLGGWRCQICGLPGYIATMPVRTGVTYRRALRCARWRYRRRVTTPRCGYEAATCQQHGPAGGRGMAFTAPLFHVQSS